MKVFLGHFIKPYYHQWLARRIPPQSQQILHRKNIFILPSKAGVGFLLTIILLWLLGTNYQNNLVLVLTFLLLSLLLTCILYTYANFSGLSIEAKRANPCFAGDVAKIECVIKNQQGRCYSSIRIGWNRESYISIDLAPNETKTVTLLLPTTQRGCHRVDRIVVSSVYPLGLIRAWARLDMAIKLWVYPKPMSYPLPISRLIELDNNEMDQATDSVLKADVTDDVSHLRRYQYGDSLKHIAWKNYAKGQGLATKVFESVTSAERQQWLYWDDFSGFTIEGRLSRLCDCVLQAEKQSMVYGVRLPNKTIALNSGKQHQESILLELALFDGKGMQSNA
jgi:uncharacterized protein (DUF58 family)